MDELTDAARAVLDFEARNGHLAHGAKEQAIRLELGLGPTQYYQRLNAALDTQAALAHNPVLVNRLRRVRAGNQRSRTARTAAVTAPPG